MKAKCNVNNYISKLLLIYVFFRFMLCIVCLNRISIPPALKFESVFVSGQTEFKRWIYVFCALLKKWNLTGRIYKGKRVHWMESIRSQQKFVICYTSVHISGLIEINLKALFSYIYFCTLNWPFNLLNQSPQSCVLFFKKFSHILCYSQYFQR